MECSSAANLQIPLPVAYSAGILCLHMVFNWFTGGHAPGPNSMAFFHSLIQSAIKMNCSLAANLQIPLSLSYSAGIFCVHMFFNWFARGHAACSNSMAFLRSLIQSGTAESSIHDTQITPDSEINEEIEKPPAQHAAGLEEVGDATLSREEVEMVMGKLGIVFSSDSDELKESLGPVELSGLFEELEPSLDEVKQTFSVFDANRDGFIDAEDLHGILRKLGLGERFSVNACEQMIKAVSNRGYDRMDLNEFVNFMENSLC